MISPADIRQKARRKYIAYLKAWLNNEPFFPLEIPFAKIKPSADYVRIKAGLKTLLAGAKETTGSGYSVTMETRTTRRYGAQSFPTRIAFENETDFLRFTGKLAEADQFKRDAALIRRMLPQLEEWLRRKPRRVIASAGDWPGLVEVCRYFLEYPRPGCYLRELPLTVDTKFIEERKAIVRDLLDDLLPETAVCAEESRFEPRFYLRYEEPLVRFRLLDPALRHRLGLPLTDVSAPLSEFAALNWAGLPLVITENKINFLTLPPLPSAIGVWGGGFEVSSLKAAAWLSGCPIFYWGDLDAQGFQILAQLRAAFPHVQSVLMDEATFHAFRQYAGPGTPCPVEALPQLTPPEQRLFERLAAGNIRLEQERISHAFAVQRLRQAVGGASEE